MKHVHGGDCRQLLIRMARGVEGDLSAAERRALARHLDECRRCGEFSESLKRTVALCGDLGGAAMSTKAKARARANVRAFLKSRRTGPVKTGTKRAAVRRR